VLYDDDFVEKEDSGIRCPLAVFQVRKENGSMSILSDPKSAWADQKRLRNALLPPQLTRHGEGKAKPRKKESDMN
jgi:hypothetical protein